MEGGGEETWGEGGNVPLDMGADLRLAGRGGEGAQVVPVRQVLRENIVGVDLVLGGEVGVLGIGVLLVRLEGVEELGSAAGAEEGAQDEDVAFIIHLLVNQVDFQGHVGVVDRVLGVVEVELQELVLGPAHRHLEAAVRGHDHLPRPLLELDLGVTLVPGEGHGAFLLLDGHHVANLADGLEVDGAGGEGGREGGEGGKEGGEGG